MHETMRFSAQTDKAPQANSLGGIEMKGEPAEEAWKERKILSLVKVLSEEDAEIDKETLVYAEKAFEELKRKWVEESSGSKKK
jgi:hypothetical protein